MGDRERLKRRARRLLALVLGVSFLLNLVPFWWGLPNHNSWAFDEIRPGVVERGLERRFSGDWATAYPPLHYYLLSLVYTPLRVAESAGLVELRPIAATSARFALGRVLSVLMATATVWLVYRVSRLVGDRMAAVLAAAAGALLPPFVYYAKTVNLEAPYLLWFLLSVFFFLRALDRRRLRDFLALAAAATFAVCTKDQAYGFYVLVPLALAGSLARERRERDGAGGGWWRVAVDRRLVLAGLLAAALFALIHNFAFNWDGFERHLRIITHRSPQLFTLYPPTVAGHAGMWLQSLRHLLFTLGLPLAVAAAVGVGRAVARPGANLRLLALLLPALSYYLFFVSVVRHNYVRFLLPVCLLLAPFAGRALASALRTRRLPRWAAGLLVVAVLGFSLARTLEVDLRMLRDGRYQVERWLAERTSESTVAVAVGRQKMLPRGVGILKWGRLKRRGPALLARWNAEYVVVSPEDLWQESERAFYDALTSGELGYEEVFRQRSRSWPGLLDTTGVFTNLDKIDPEMVVFRRIAPAEAGPP